MKFDLGKIDRGVVAKKELTIKNAGTEKLVLGNVEVSCGCTGTVVSNKELLPGDTTSLLITFNSKNFNGPVHKTVTGTRRMRSCAHGRHKASISGSNHGQSAGE